jgi:hypothetical protein
MKKLALGVGAALSFWSGAVGAEDAIAKLKRERPSARVELDQAGHLRSLRDPGVKRYPGEAKDAARAYLRDLGPVVPGEYGEPVLRSVAGREIVHFPAVSGGIPVLGRGLSVSLAPGGRPSLLWLAPHTPSAPETLASTPSPSTQHSARLSPEEAAQNARRSARFSAGAYAEPELVLLPLGDSQRLVYQVFVSENFSAWKVLVDAETGKTWLRVPVSVSARANVYEIGPGEDGDVPPSIADLPAITSNTAGGGMLNDFVRAQNCGAPFTNNLFTCTPQGSAVEDANGDFFFDPVFEPGAEFLNDSFAQVNLFFQANRIHDFFQSLGATDELGQIRFLDGTCCQTLDDPLPSIANVHFGDDIPGFNNAFFTGSAIVFGSGSQRDFSYDADLIYHEYTHAVISFGIQGFFFDTLGLSSSGGGLNEGTADIFSSLFLDDPELAEFAGFGQFRTIENVLRYPNDLEGEVHGDGEIWGGAFWEIKDRLEGEFGFSKEETRDLLARIYIATLFGLPTPASDFGDAARVAIDFAAEIGTEEGLGNDLESLFRETFVSRGILRANGEKEERVVSLNEPVGPPTTTCGNFGIEDAYCQFTFGPEPGSDFMPGILQYKLTIPPGQEALLRVDTLNFNLRKEPFRVFVREEEAVRFLFSGNRLFIDADDDLRSVTGSTLLVKRSNLSSQDKTFFFAIGVERDTVGFGVIATVSEPVFSEVSLDFTGGCQSEPTRPLSWTPLAALLAGLYLARRRFSRPS